MPFKSHTRGVCSLAEAPPNTAHVPYYQFISLTVIVHVKDTGEV